MRAPLSSESLSQWQNRLFTVALASFFIFAAIIPSAMNTLATVVLLLALAMGWKGLTSLSKSQHIVLLGLVLYVAFSLPSLFNVQNWDAAGWRFERYHPFLFSILVAGILLRTQKLERQLLVSLSASAIAIGCLALYQHYVIGQPRVGYGTGLNPNIFGHTASLIATVLFCGILMLPLKPIYKIVLAVCITSAGYAAFATGSRGVFIAMLFTLTAIAIGYLFINKDKAQRTRVLFITSFVTVAFIVAMSQSEFWSAHWQRLMTEPKQFLSGDYSLTSVSARAVMLIGAWEIWLEHPWIGTGLGDSQDHFDALMAAGQLPAVANSSFHIFHNIYADAAASTGLLGLSFMLLGIFILPAWFFIQQLIQPKQSHITTWAAFTGLAVLVNLASFGLTNSWLYLRGLPFVLILLLALIVLVKTTQER